MNDTNRAEFEHHYANMTGEGLPGSLDGVYDYSYTQMCWLTWQAARAQPERVALMGLQAKIDSLLLEYCPDDMTPEQISEWARRQRPLNISVQSDAGIPASPPLTQYLIAEAARDDVAGDAKRFQKLSSTMLDAADEMDRLRIGDGEAGDDEAHRIDRTVAAIEYHNAKNAIRAAIAASKGAQ